MRLSVRTNYNSKEVHAGLLKPGEGELRHDWLVGGKINQNQQNARNGLVQ
jgi:hypothetical protein